MKKFLKLLAYALVPASLFMVAYVFVFTGEKISNNATADSIAFIAEHFNGSGKLIDYYDEIGVDGIEDIKLFMKDDDVEIEFGGLSLTWKLEDFVTEENQALLDKIFIKIYRDKETGKIRVFYKDEEIERWVS